jgi:hypothetical protein
MDQRVRVAVRQSYGSPAALRVWARAALLTLAPGWDAEVGSILADLAACRQAVNVALVVDALQRYAFEVRRHHEDRIRREREAKLRRAARRRRPGASWLDLSPWRFDPEAGSPLVQARSWALYQLECARVPRRLRPRLLDLVA